jgi:hypothetical protein
MRRRSYLQGCKVDDTIDVGMRSKDLEQSFLICNIDLVKFWSLPA